MSECFGIKIILQDKDSPVTEYTTYGLYNVASNNSEFRWIQNSISGISGWKNGMIIENGLSPFTLEIDLRGGGNTSFPGTGEVSIKNNIKFHEFLSGRGIILTGLKLEIWHFSSIPSSRCIRTYVCGESSYTTSEYKIPFKGIQEKRIANIMNTVSSVQFPNASPDTIGKAIPVSFGRLIPKIDANTGIMTRNSIARFMRVDDKEELTKFSDNYFSGSGYTKTISFPVVDVSDADSLIYICELRQAANSSGPLSQENMYVRVVDGTGKDQIRRVSGLSWSESSTDLTFVVTDFFETELSASDSSTDGRSWVQFIIVNRKYYCDHWTCAGFFDANEAAKQVDADIYSYTEADGIQRIAPYGYTIANSGPSKNSLDIDPKLFDGDDLDNQTSYLILPVESIAAYDEPDLSKWITSPSFLLSETYDGLYINDLDDYEIDTFSISDLSYITDRISTTYAQLVMSGHYITGVNPGWDTVIALNFSLPDLPPGFTFSNFYIGLKLIMNVNDHDNGDDCIIIFLRKFKYKINATILPVDDPYNDTTVNNLPDFYYTDYPQTGNKNFFAISTSLTEIIGVHNAVFNTGISSKEEYESYCEGLVWFRRTGVTSPINTSISFSEMAFIFEKSSDIEENIYAPIHGRITGSLDPGRIGESSLLESPTNLLEHVCRLQDYRDTCSPLVSGWGLQYASSSLVATTGYGSFDAVTDRDYSAAAQFFDYDNGYTDKIKTGLCSEFAMANWQDDNGYERVISIPESRLNPFYTITLNDIIDRESIKITELPQEKIISEPFVNYNKNAATGKYDNQLSIKNTSASVYNAVYVSGFNNATDGQLLWNACHSLALISHQTNKPSTDLTDLDWANGNFGYTIAYDYLRRLINWQFNNEIDFKTHYNIAGSWQECTPINIVFSHQTNNVVKSAIVEKITVNPNHPYDMMIRAIMYA